MTNAKQNLAIAEQKAKDLFSSIEERGLIVAGKTEKELCDEIIQIAKEDLGIEKHWSKKIVRTGINTLQPFIANPPDLVIQKDDIYFLTSTRYTMSGKLTLEELIILEKIH